MTGTGRKPRILIVKHSLNRYTMPLPVPAEDAEVTYYVWYLEPTIAEALARDGIRFEKIGLRKMWGALLSRAYDFVVVSIEWFPEFKGTFVLCKLLGIPVAYLSDRRQDTRPGERRSLKQWVFQALSDWLQERGDYYLLTGTLQAAYYRGRGITSEKIRLFYEARCTRMPLERRALTGAAVRQRLGLGKKTVFLYTGRLLKKRKNLDLVIDAFHEVREENPETALVLVGYGRDEHALQAYCLEKGIGDVHFAGFLEYLEPDL